MEPTRRMVVPTDFSETADRALATAIELARSLRSQILLVHVHSPVVLLPPPIDAVSLPSVFPEMLKQVEDALQARAARVRDAGLECQVDLLEGNAHVEIVRHAEKQKADLIVMGTHGRSGLAHAILGSVTERVVHRAPCPVLVVPDRKR